MGHYSVLKRSLITRGNFNNVNGYDILSYSVIFLGAFYVFFLISSVRITREHCKRTCFHEYCIPDKLFFFLNVPTLVP